MGEKVEDEKKAAEGEERKEIPPLIGVVLQLDLDCEGCAKKVRRAVSHFEGVEKVKADWSTNKLTVTGNVDSALLREKVETKTKKKVELISPQTRKDAGGEKKAEDTKPKETVVTTVVMKIRLHCDRCAHKIEQTIVKNVDGVDSVKTELEKDLVSVTGTLDANEFATFLKEKLKRSVEIVPPPKKDGMQRKRRKRRVAAEIRKKIKKRKRKRVTPEIRKKRRRRLSPP